jgi:2-hydroxychromene-2-carboxylate isomerase
MKKAIMPYVLKVISSALLLSTKRKLHMLRRKVLNQEAILEVFIKADDPYSYLLIQALASIESRFSINLKFYVFNDIDPQMYPQLEMWQRYANYDAYHIAKLYGFQFPSSEKLPKLNEDAIKTLTCALVAIEQDDEFLSKADGILTDFWFNSVLPASGTFNRENSLSKLIINQTLLASKGHYLGGMIYFEGEWYWGIDRLDHLEQRLIETGFAHRKNEQVQFNLTYKDFCQPALDEYAKSKYNQTLKLYWSARSPYSYIGLERAVKLAEHYQIPLEIKPVLPMMMRNMYVPEKKKMYIFLDTKREANKLGIDYGFVADPLGVAVERCYALIEYARSENKLQVFLLSFARAVNAEGIRAETDSGLEKILTRCGLDWTVAKDKLANKSWHIEVQNNLDEMFELGCWGVPTMRYGDAHFWGQDRFILLENAIKKSLNP